VNSSHGPQLGGSTMRNLALAALVIGFIGLVGSVQADDKAGNPSGTWKWSVEIKGNKREFTAKINVKDGKVTGTLSGGKAETKISDGTYKDGKIAFTVIREFKDQKFTTKYSGKVEGDTIKGTIENTFNGKDFKTDWDAKREKKAKD
jgi:hypothetical protein